MTEMLDVVVLIATYNRAALLDATFASLAGLRVRRGLRWEAVVVDNNSGDDTRLVVERHAARFPVPLRYLFEGRQGRSAALNAGLAATSTRLVAFTDDDVRVRPDWLQTGCDALDGNASIDYVGGPVRPMWEAEPPRWLALDRTDLWGTIAIQDYGFQPFIYEERRLIPLGVNMAVRRSLIDLIGGFNPGLGRTKGPRILGQEVPEWWLRAGAAGARGLYLPAMEVEHHVPAARLRKAYFRRWWFGKGVSKARLEAAQLITELGLDLGTVPHWLGIPRYMFGTACRDVGGLLTADRPAERFRREMMLAYFAGYAWERLRRKNRGRQAPHPRVQPRASTVPAACARTSIQRTSNVTTTGRWSDGM